MLHKASKVIGFHVFARDGRIGHVDDLLVDEETWAMRYLVVDTSNWVGGRAVLISPAAMVGIDPVAKRVGVALTRDQVKSAPSVESADIPLAETLPAIWIM